MTSWAPVLPPAATAWARVLPPPPVVWASLLPPRGYTVVDGLAGDGKTDDAAAINAALAAHGKAFLPPPRSSYLIGSPLEIASRGGLASALASITAKPNFGNLPMIRNATRTPANDAARDAAIELLNFTLDGQKNLNATATEHAHGVQFYAVNGAKISGVKSRNMKGDGLYVGSATGVPTRLSANLVGDIQVEDCDRQGVAFTGVDGVGTALAPFAIRSTRSRYLGLDIEPNANQIVRNVWADLISVDDGTGTSASGGFSASPNGNGAIIDNINVALDVADCDGVGAFWRGVTNLKLAGVILRPTSNGAGSIDGASAASSTELDLLIVSPGNDGLVTGDPLGGSVTGKVTVVGAIGKGASLRYANIAGLVLDITGARQQGVSMFDLDGFTASNWRIVGSRQDNLWLRGGSSGNRFPGLVSTGSVLGYGVREDSGCDDNVGTGTTLSGNAAGQKLLSGASSSFT